MHTVGVAVLEMHPKDISGRHREAAEVSGSH